MNTLTGLIPIIYASLNIVSREQIGFLPAITMDTALGERAAINQTVRAAVAPAATSSDVTASMALPDGDDQAIGSVDMTITHSKAVQIPWPSEEQLAVRESVGQSLFAQQLEEAFRHLGGLVERSIAEQYHKASHAFGNAGTVPFSSGLSDAAQIRKLLVDNGARGDMRLVVGSTAGAELRSNTILTNASAAGTDQTLRKGTLLDLSGLSIHESAEVVTHSPADADAYQLNGAQEKGASVLDIDTGSGAFADGDVVTIGTSNHVVKASTADTLTLGAPGLKAATDDDAAITVAESFEANMAFTRSSIVLAARAPAAPDGGDAAVDSTIVVDPISGLAFEINIYVGYRKKVIEVALAWGSQVIKPEHCVLLLG